jgi:hypothetical protein
MLGKLPAPTRCMWMVLSCGSYLRAVRCEPAMPPHPTPTCDVRAREDRTARPISKARNKRLWAGGSLRPAPAVHRTVAASSGRELQQQQRLV